jgi:hypothetical protein
MNIHDLVNKKSSLDFAICFYFKEVIYVQHMYPISNCAILIIIYLRNLFIKKINVNVCLNGQMSLAQSKV